LIFKADDQMTEKNKPHVVSLTKDEADAFKNRVVNSSLGEQDKKIMALLRSLLLEYFKKMIQSI
jgi:hypothetical protein